MPFDDDAAICKPTTSSRRLQHVWFYSTNEANFTSPWRCWCVSVKTRLKPAISNLNRTCERSITSPVRYTAGGSCKLFIQLQTQNRINLNRILQPLFLSDMRKMIGTFRIPILIFCSRHSWNPFSQKYPSVRHCG